MPEQTQTDMSVYDHIGELRRRVMITMILFVVFTVIGFVFSDDIVFYLQQQPSAENINMVVINITDAFKVYFLFALTIGVVLTFPIALFQIWAFVKPGLTPKERKMTLSYIPGATILFVLGLAFAYFWLFPFIVGFLMNIAQNLNAQEMYGMPQYFSFMISFVLPFGFLFQMPLLVLFLTGLGIVTPQFLTRARKYAYFILFVVAALLTPPELLSHVIVTLPLIILYEISITLSKIAYKRKRKAQAAADAKLESSSEE